MGKADVFWELIGVLSECPTSGLGPLDSRLGRGVSSLQDLESKEKDLSKHYLNTTMCGTSHEVGALDWASLTPDPAPCSPPGQPYH